MKRLPQPIWLNEMGIYLPPPKPRVHFWVTFGYLALTAVLVGAVIAVFA
jgi:hypothetical protein